MTTTNLELLTDLVDRDLIEAQQAARVLIESLVADLQRDLAPSETRSELAGLDAALHAIVWAAANATSRIEALAGAKAASRTLDRVAMFGLGK